MGGLTLMKLPPIDGKTKKQLSLRQQMYEAIKYAIITCELAPGEPISESDLDRKSTRLNSSHGYISYAVFCLKKKKKKNTDSKQKDRECERGARWTAVVD